MNPQISPQTPKLWVSRPTNVERRTQSKIEIPFRPSSPPIWLRLSVLRSNGQYIVPCFFVKEISAIHFKIPPSLNYLQSRKGRQKILFLLTLTSCFCYKTFYFHLVRAISLLPRGGRASIRYLKGCSILLNGIGSVYVEI